jgi:hypothetical protein
VQWSAEVYSRLIARRSSARRPEVTRFTFTASCPVAPAWRWSHRVGFI